MEINNIYFLQPLLIEHDGKESILLVDFLREKTYSAESFLESNDELSQEVLKIVINKKAQKPASVDAKILEPIEKQKKSAISIVSNQARRPF